MRMPAGMHPLLQMPPTRLDMSWGLQVMLVRPPILLLTTLLVLHCRVGRATESLVVSVSTEKGVYTTTEDIRLEIRMSNRGANALLLPATIADFPLMPKIEIFRDSEKVPYRGLLGSRAELEDPCSLVVLPPDHFYGGCFSIVRGDHAFDLAAVRGTYTVVCSYTIDPNEAVGIKRAAARGCPTDLRYLVTWIGSVNAKCSFRVE